VSAGSWASEMRLCQQSNENTGIGEAIARARDVRPTADLVRIRDRRQDDRSRLIVLWLTL
jgi:hypothetical protein